MTRPNWRGLKFPWEGLPDSPQVPDQTATRKPMNAVMMPSPVFVEKPTYLHVMDNTEEGEIVGGPRLANATERCADHPVCK